MKRQMLSCTPVFPLKPYPNSDQNGQSLYPFSDQNGAKPKPLWDSKYKGVPPGSCGSNKALFV